jgi:hypothetical protein
MGASAFRAKIEIPLVPFGKNLHHVIPLRILRRREDEIWLQVGFQQLIGFQLYFQLQSIGYFGGYWFPWMDSKYTLRNCGYGQWKSKAISTEDACSNVSRAICTIATGNLISLIL